MQPEPLRIVHCFRSPVGGIFRHVRDLAERHSAAGHQVGIICDSITGGAFEDSLFDGIRPYLALGLTRLPIRRVITPADAVAALRTLARIKELRPDVLHGHGAKGGAYARIIGTRLRVSGYCVARFYSPHGGSLHFDPARPSGRTFFAIERLLERMTDRLIFVSAHERQAYHSKVRAPRCPQMLVHNGLRDSEFEPVNPVQDAADFLFIGMMRDIKGPDIFIDAFAGAEKLAGRKLSGVMVGDGDDKPRYRAQIERAGLKSRLVMHAAMPAREAFALARTVVVPSRAEAMPYIVLEAVAAGRPVLASRVGGIPEILGPDSTALLPADDVEALAQAMARTIEVPARLQAEMPDLIRFKAGFSAGAMSERILSAYRDALARPTDRVAGASLSSLS